MLGNNFDKFSVIIPVFNEKQTVLGIIKRVRQVHVDGLEKEIIVIDDGSTDGTKEILLSLKDENIKILYHHKNMGKGAALRTGFKELTGQIVVIQDADLEYNPKDYLELIQPILEGKADIVYGSRFVGDKPHRVLYFWHYVGNKIVTLMSNMFSNLNLTDVETCYKAFKREVIDNLKLKENRFGFEPEFTAKAAKNKYRFYEIGISYSGRTYEEGKKLKAKDGLRTLWCIIKYGIFG